MKNLIVICLICILFNSLVGQTQSEFIIGADWINNLNQPGGHPYTMTAQDWANIRDLGLTWGDVIYNTPTDLTYANSALDGAEPNGIKLILDRYAFRPPTQGQRWQYHPEYSQQYASTSRIGSATSDNAANTFPDDNGDQNTTWQAKLGTDLYPGYMAKGLLSPFCTEQADGLLYYVKVRIRLEIGTPLTHTPVVVVTAVRNSDGFSSSPDTIYADDPQFVAGDHYVYKEITALSFTKNSSGPFTANSRSKSSSVPAPNPYGPTGIHPAGTQAAGSSFDYQVYWPKNVTCYLDYVIVDDTNANDTFTGYYDSVIDQEVNNFKSRTGLGRYNVDDEIDPDFYGQYLTNGYVEKRIKAIVVPAGVPTKTGFHYNIGWIQEQRYGSGPENIGRDINWTQNNQSASDIYAIKPSTPLPDPDPVSYTSSEQTQIQESLITYLQQNITYANRYGVPFWFTPQVQSWTVPNWFREPTVMEIQQMVNLGLAYGAKGIIYFLYYSLLDQNNNVIANGLVDGITGDPRRIIYDGTSYAGDKWATVKSINQKLAILGPTLVNLTWQNAFSIYQSQPTGNWGITSVTTPDSPGQTYVELGEFADASNNKYFMLVNRRTISTENRNITVTFSLPTGSYEVSDVVSGNAWIIPANGSMTDNLNPGEGRLYKVSPATYTTTRTIPVNATLTVGAGATASFASGVGLTVYGKLIVNGLPPSSLATFTRSGSSGNWGSIQLIGGGASNSTISYANILNGTEVDVNGANNVTIQNCNITNNSGQGINVTLSSNFTAQYDSIKNTNAYNGIYISGGSNNSCYYDVITKSDHQRRSSTAGIYYNTSSGTVGMNDIDYYYSGILAAGGSTPNAYINPWPSIKNNRVTSCTYGLWVYHQSYCLFGITTSYPMYGLNSFYNNSPYDALVGMSGDGTASGLYAESDWWGTPNPTPSWRYYYVYSGCYGYFINPLSADPWSGYPTPSIKQTEDNVPVVSSIVQNNSHSTPMNSNQTAVSTSSITNDSLLIGVGLRDQGKYTEAKDFFLSYLNTHPDNQAAYVYLYSCADSSTTPGIIQYFNNLPKQAAPDHKLLLAHLYLMQGDVKSAKQVNNAIIASNLNTPLAVRANLNNLSIALNCEHDPSTASTILNQVEAQASLSAPMELSIAQAALKFYVDPKTGKMPNINSVSSSDSVQSISAADSVQAVNSGLIQNYPNPFNPTTTISYQIPKEGRVTIKIFDIIGREITTLVDEFKPSGSYTIQFDASRLSSGIYFYSIRSGNYNAVKKMSLIK